MPRSVPRSVHACRVPPEPSGALRRPLPRRVSVSDAFATPSWDYDFFSIFLVFLSAPIAKRKRRHMHPPSPEAEQLWSVRSRPSIPIPVRSWLMSLQSCSLTDMSQVSRCRPRRQCTADGCGVRVCGSCPHLCGTIMGTVRRCSNSSMVALPNAKTSKLYYVLPYVVHRFHRSGLAVAVPAECLAGLLLG